MTFDHGNNINKIKAFRTIRDELLMQMPEARLVEGIKRDVKEQMLLNLEPFVKYQFEHDPTKCEFTVRGCVTLARLGQWEEDADEIYAGHRWHHCNICGAEADEDAAGNQMLTAYCSRCGAYLGGDYD